MGDRRPKQVDLEKGQEQQETQPSLGEGFSNAFSKAGEGITSAFNKAGEGMFGKANFQKMEDGVENVVSSLEEKAGIKKKDPKEKARKEKHEKRFHKNYQPLPREEPKDTNIVGNITKLLPANTFLMFQTLAPLSTNDGNCHGPEIAMTGFMLFILCGTCMLVCFTDTIQFNGKVYHGLVTMGGLWNPAFKGDPAFTDLRKYERDLAKYYADKKAYRKKKELGEPLPPKPIMPEKENGPHIIGSTYSSGNGQYHLKFADFLHAILSATAFATLTMFTNPVSTCFYPNIPSTVVKTLPLLVGFIVSAIFAFSPPARNGVAHPLPPRVASQMDNFKPKDPKGVVHGPQLPPQPPGHGDHGAGKLPEHHDDGGFTESAKRMFGKIMSGGDHSSGHGLADGVMSMASGFLHKHPDLVTKAEHMLGDEIEKHPVLAAAAQSAYAEGAKDPHFVQLQEHLAKTPGGEALMAGLMSTVTGAGTHPALAAAAQSAYAQGAKDSHFAQLQEMAKTPGAEALMAGLMSAATGAGAHPALAAAAQSAYAQGAKDAVLQIHKDIQTATSAPLAGVSRQSSLALSRANSILQSAGPSLSPYDVFDALSHQAGQVLQHSGLAASPILHSPGSESAIALATAEALKQGGFLPGMLSPQAHALSAFAQGVGNLNLSSVNTLTRDVSSLVQQGGKSQTEVQDYLARQQSAFTQGLNTNLQTMYNPAASVAQDFAGFIHNGSQSLNQIQKQVAQQQAANSQGTFAANLASGLAREAATVLQEGADHGMTGVQDELAKQKAAMVQNVDTQVQSITQPVSSLAHNAASLVQQGSQVVENEKADLLKQKEAMTQQLNTQARALSTPATSVAHDIAVLRTPGSEGLIGQLSDATSQRLADGVNTQFAESLARGMARGMSMRMQAMASVPEHMTSMAQELQPPVSVAIDVASMLQQGSQMHTQLARQQLAMSQGLNAAQVQAAAAMLQRQVSLTQSFNNSLSLHPAQQVVETHLRRLASLQPQFSPAMTVHTVVDSRPMQQMVDYSAQRLANSARLVIEDVTDAASRQAAAAVAPGTSALAAASARIWRERPESTEITDSISMEEITSESETEGRGEYRATPTTSQMQIAGSNNMSL